MAIISSSNVTVAGSTIPVLELPANTINAMADINLVNTGTTDAIITVYIADVDTPQSQHIIEYEVTLQPSLPLTRTCGPVTAAEKIFVLSDTDNVAVRATAIVETL